MVLLRIQSCAWFVKNREMEVIQSDSSLLQGLGVNYSVISVCISPSLRLRKFNAAVTRRLTVSFNVASVKKISCMVIDKKLLVRRKSCARRSLPLLELVN